ncbi:hypothetical protein HYX58_04855 [Candidatus Dependentiae bacterium]|nr:hypothetical protein [Candidatus Dependentiae bacterium]
MKLQKYILLTLMLLLPVAPIHSKPLLSIITNGFLAVGSIKCAQICFETFKEAKKNNDEQYAEKLNTPYADRSLNLQQAKNDYYFNIVDDERHIFGLFFGGIFSLAAISFLNEAIQ